MNSHVPENTYSPASRLHLLSRHSRAGGNPRPLEPLKEAAEVRGGAKRTILIPAHLVSRLLGDPGGAERMRTRRKRGAASRPGLRWGRPKERLDGCERGPL